MTTDVDSAREFDALTTSAAKVDRPGHGQVEVTGADAQTFLQSLLSQDLEPLHAGLGAHALLLQPQGKLDHDLRVLVVASDDVWLDCASGTAPDLVASLTRFKIRVDVTLTDCTSDRRMVSVRGPRSHETVANALGVVVPDVRHAFVETSELMVVVADWHENPGVDILGPSPAVEAAWDALDAPVAHAEAFARLRIASGIPRAGNDIDRSTIPQEAFLERDAVSFTKGCFLGQELVCRIDSRGHVNRGLRILHAQGPVPVGAVVTREGTDVGRVTSVAPMPDGAIALAMLRREVVAGAVVDVVTSAGIVEATVTEVPGP